MSWPQKTLWVNPAEICSGSAEHCVLRTIIWMGLILDFKVEKKDKLHVKLKLYGEKVYWTKIVKSKYQ